MDQFGDLMLSSSVGYSGGHVFYSDLNTICFINGNSVKFINLKDDVRSYLSSPGDGVQTFAVNPNYAVIAFSENGIEAKIFVYKLQNLEEPATILKGSSGLGYVSLAFANNGSILASCTNIPTVQLVVWNWVTGVELCSLELHLPIKNIQFNPLNWRQFTCLNKKELSVWNIQQVNDQYFIQDKHITLPFPDGTFGMEFINAPPSGSRPTTGHGGLHLTKSAIAGVPEQGRLLSSGKTVLYSKSLDLPYLASQRERCTAKSHCWAPGNILYVGCEERMLLRVDSETGYVDILQNEENNNGLSEKENLLLDFNCMRMHNLGLFVGGKDGKLRCLRIQDKTFTVKSQQNIGHVLSSLCFSINYEELVIGSADGFIYKYNVTGSLQLVLDDVCDEIIGIVSLPGNQFFVTCKSRGLFQVWRLKQNKEIYDSICVASLHLNCKIFSIAAPSSSSSVFVGTERGSVVVIDVTKCEKPRCVYEQYLHVAPVTKLSLDRNGKILLTGSNDNKLLIINALVSSGLDVIGHIEAPGSILCISCVDINSETSNPSWKVLVGVSSADHKPGCNQLMELEINNSLLSKSPSLYLDETRLLKDASVSKRVYLLKTFIYDLCLVSYDVAVALTHQGGKIAKFVFSNYEDTQSNLLMEAAFTYSGHALSDGCIALSCHNKWIVTGAPDGYIIVRAVGAMSNAVVFHAGNYRTGGIKHVSFSADAQSILTVSNGSTVSIWNWKFTASGKSKAAHAVEAYGTLMASVKETRNIEDGRLAIMTTLITDSANGKQKTWLQKAVEMAHAEEDKKYSETKTSLRKDINNLRQQVLSLIKINEERPEIERLERHEFNLDEEERQKIVAIREKYLKELQEEIELSDTENKYLRHLIKMECWDEMQVKGRSIKSLLTNTFVENYPMRKRTTKELKELEVVSQQRKVETIEANVRKSIFAEGIGSYRSLVEKSQGGGDDDSSLEFTNGMGKENAATYGSEGFVYGGYNELLESQFVLHTKQQKLNQIVLLKDCIYKIKTLFNKRFDEVLNFKLQEIRRINERNVRIRKILQDMSLEEEITEIDLDYREQPECLLDVRDEEVSAKKYIIEEEGIIEDVAKTEEGRQRSENADNLRERALEMMMNGRLETNLEEELKKDIEAPEFMLTKASHTWNEEEQRVAKEHERKRQQLDEEREKYRKALEAELRKLQGINIEAISNFDERWTQLFRRKTNTDLVILQEELKIVRLNASIMVDEELASREVELLDFLEAKKEERQRNITSVEMAKKNIDNFRDSYETLMADDRTFDKTFRKEFHDVDLHTIDVLYKFFKKRPRAQRTLKAAVDTQHDVLSVDGNPFKPRPSSSRAASAAASNLEKSMQELDSVLNMPDNMNAEEWQKMVYLRRIKVEKEQQLKEKALIIAEMNAYLQSQVDRDEDLKLTIEKTYEDIQILREERFRFNLNLEVQLLLKQGQVEVAPCDFVHDYKDSLLIHRSAVEDLNAAIKTLGDMKLASMHESKEFRKGIHILAWELKEMFMKAEDLQTAAHDLQLLRVTKELQVYLSDPDQRQSKHQEITTLEKTIDMYNTMHVRNIQDRKRVLRQLRKEIREKTDENAKLDSDLEELALKVAERKNINEANVDRRNEDGSNKRMQDVITRRKLVDLAKAQTSEIGMLRAELERLRMRTFPALVQLDQ